MKRLLLLVCALAAMSSYVEQGPGATDTYTACDWMRHLPDSMSLGKVTIPGTHDSGATCGNRWVRCQNWGYNDQIENGIRFLDIRLKLENGRLRVFHGSTAMNTYMDEMDSICRSFLERHPSETIIISIKNENLRADDNEKSLFHAIIDSITRTAHWYTSNYVPTVGEARGKMVLYRRFPSPVDMGIDMTRWPDNSVDFYSGTSGARVQDMYRMGIANAANIDKKWNAVRSLMEDAASSIHIAERFHMNFCSANGILADPQTVARKIIPRLESYLDSIPDMVNTGTRPCEHAGWIVMDFPTALVIRKLYMLNFAL